MMCIVINYNWVCSINYLTYLDKLPNKGERNLLEHHPLYYIVIITSASGNISQRFINTNSAHDIIMCEFPLSLFIFALDRSRLEYIHDVRRGATLQS